MAQPPTGKIGKEVRPVHRAPVALCPPIFLRCGCGRIYEISATEMPYGQRFTSAMLVGDANSLSKQFLTLEEARLEQ